MAHFVFVEFTDPMLRELLLQVRSALQGRRSSRPVHVTVRGPYRGRKPSASTFEQCRQALRGRGVRIAGSGMFEVENGFVVFLRAESAAFREMWWKPDYRVSEHGINPHLTMFETPSKEEAKVVEGALRSQQINIHTYGVELTVYSSSQGTLLGDVRLEMAGASLAPTDYGSTVPAQLLMAARRAREAIDASRRSKRRVVATGEP